MDTTSYLVLFVLSKTGVGLGERCQHYTPAVTQRVGLAAHKPNRLEGAHTR